jgi:hypothetical protein
MGIRYYFSCPRDLNEEGYYVFTIDVRPSTVVGTASVCQEWLPVNNLTLSAPRQCNFRIHLWQVPPMFRTRSSLKNLPGFWFTVQTLGSTLFDVLASLPSLTASQMKIRHGRMVRTSDSQPEGRGFESRRRHGAVSVSRIP